MAPQNELIRGHIVHAVFEFMRGRYETAVEFIDPLREELGVDQIAGRHDGQTNDHEYQGTHEVLPSLVSYLGHLALNNPAVSGSASEPRLVCHGDRRDISHIPVDNIRAPERHVIFRTPLRNDQLRAGGPSITQPVRLSDQLQLTVISRFFMCSIFTTGTPTRSIRTYCLFSIQAPQRSGPPPGHLTITVDRGFAPGHTAWSGQYFLPAVGAGPLHDYEPLETNSTVHGH